MTREEIRKIADEIGEECMTVGDADFGAKTFADIAYMILIERLALIQQEKSNRAAPPKSPESP